MKLIQGSGIPQVYWYGNAGDKRALVMELLGVSLERVFKSLGRRFSVNTVIMIGVQLLGLIENLHYKSYIHRDLKPDNFVVGLHDLKNLIYIIDFGLAKQYQDSISGLHIPYRDNRSFTGTARYASINTHIGVEQSRRDDIESLIYILIYFLKGSLPWQGIKTHTKREKYLRVLNYKMSTPIELLCKELPKELASLLYYARGLKFEEEPDYKHIKNILLKVLPRSALKNELTFESAPPVLSII